MSIIVDKPYSKEPKTIPLLDFHMYPEQFITRPPYQRKNVWTTEMKEALIESIFRRFYVPNIVLREVTTPSHMMKYEVVDGQQRIIAVQEFFEGKIKLPERLKDVTGDAGKKYNDLKPEVKNHIHQQSLDATVLGGLTNPQNQKNQQIVAKVFWNLQQGKTLSYMEVEHSKLYSASRNFIVKYSDNMCFDYNTYQSKDDNPNRHKFFELLNIDNERLDHLGLMGRFLLLEENNGAAELGKNYLITLIDDWNNKPLEDFEKTHQAKRCIKTLNVLYDIFKNDPGAKSGGPIPELDREYIIISIYLLAERLVHGNWNFSVANYDKFRSYVHTFHERWGADNQKDADMLRFREQRQQNKKAVEIRDQLLTEWFFEYCPELNKRDSQRNFSYLDRIRIYRKNKGLCQACLAQGKTEEDALVPWNKFEADHLKPWSKEGKTTIKNGQVLCSYHNQSKGSKTKQG